MSTFTCLTCKVNFATNEWQKQHYKSEWHQYNLKRKLVDLNSVPYEVFEKLKARQQSTVEPKEAPNITNYCECCRKLFASTKAFDQHCQSKKHREMKEKMEDSVDNNQANSKTKSTAQSNSVPIKGDDGTSNVKSPKVFEGSQSTQGTATNKIEIAEDVDDADDSDDGEDWESVDDDYESSKDAIPPSQCFFCSHESESIEDNVEHMSQYHSFFIPDVDYLVDLEGLLTYLGEKIGIDHKCLWCSYLGKSFRTIKSTRQHMLSKGHSKINFEQADILFEYADFYDYSKSYPDAESGVDKDEEVKIPTIGAEDDSWELVLPSGATIGHRALLRYYKQNLKPIVEKTSSKSANQRILDKVMSNYKALGWTGTKGEAAVLRAKDINYFNKLVSRRQLDIGMKHNRVLQQHFRNQVFF